MQYYKHISKHSKYHTLIDELLTEPKKPTLQKKKKKTQEFQQEVITYISKKECLFDKSASYIENLWRENRIKIEAIQSSQDTDS